MGLDTGRLHEMNPLLSTMKESASLATAALARELRDAGRDIVSLALGDTHFSPPSSICQSLYHSD